MKTIFVSSTFRDFQQERDVLHDRVLPTLNEQARAYGESVNFCDLRWGVDTSEQAGEDESSAKVLSVCMNEIDRARPYMLVLLGERYGFMPGSEAIGREASRKAMELADLEISVTALEIEYGAMQNRAGLEHTWFYFRELESKEELPQEYRPESEAHARKLSELKARILRLAGNHVRFYKACWNDGRVTALDDFAAQACQDLQEELRTEWESYEKLDPYERDALSQWNYLREKARSFSVFGAFADAAADRLEQPGSVLTAVRGPAGSGKTTLFARVCQLMEGRGWTVLPYCSGSTSLSTDAFGILTSLVWRLESMLGQEHMEERQRHLREDTVPNASLVPDDGTAQEDTASGLFSLRQWRERLDELCGLAVKTRKILIAVDALDQLQESELRDLLGFLPSRRTDRLRCFVTCLDEHPLPLGTDPLQMPAMDAEERRAVVKSVLSSMGKELSEPVIAALTAKAQANNPLYLYLAAARLSLMNASDFQAIRDRGDGMDAITAQQLEVVAALPDALEGLAAALAKAVGERVHPAMAEAAFRCLALSRHGLRLADLDGLLSAEGVPFSALEFAQLVNYMNELFLLRADGQYDFLHKSLRQGLRTELEQRQIDVRAEHQKLTDYLSSLPEEDDLRIREMTWESMEANDIVTFVFWMTCIWSHQEGEAGAMAARDIAARCRNDGGSWIISCLNEVGDRSFDTEHAREQAIIQLCFLLVVRFGTAFGSTRTDHRLRLLVAGAAVDRLEQLAAESDSPSTMMRSTLSQCCREYGTNLRQADNLDLRRQAIPMLERSCTLLQSVLEDTHSADWQLRLAEAEWTLANAYCLDDTKESMLKAVQYGEQSLNTYENARDAENEYGKLVNRISAHMAVAAACCKLADQAHLEKGYTHASACVRELEPLLQKDRSLIYLDVLGKCYTTLCVLCIGLADLGVPGKKKEALQYAEQTPKLLEECIRLRNTPESRSAAASAWANLGKVYQEQEGEIRWDMALTCLKKGQALHQALADELETPEPRSKCINGLGLLGEAYEARGHKGDLELALDCYQRGKSRAALLARDVPAPVYIRQHCVFLSRMAYVCKDLGGTERLIQARQLWMERSDCYRVLVEANPNAEDCDNWSFGLDHLRKTGERLQALGGIDLLKQAADCYETSLEGHWTILEHFPTEQARQRRDQAQQKLNSICLELAQTALAAADDAGDEALRAGSQTEALFWMGKALAVSLHTPDGRRTDGERTLAAFCLCNMAAVQARIGGAERLAECLRLLHAALDELDRVEEQDEAWYRVRLNVGKNGRGAAQVLEPEGYLSHPEGMSFAEVELSALRALTKEAENDADLQELNQLCYELGSFYEDRGGDEDLALSLALYQEEAAAGERRLALTAAAEQPEEEALISLRDDLSGTCYRIARRLRGLENEDALTHALSYAERDIELSQSLFQTEPTADRADDLANSALQLGLIHAALGGEEHNLEALRWYETERSLREQLANAQPDMDTLEDVALACYRLSGLCRTIGGTEHLLAARAYSRRDVELSNHLLTQEPTAKRKRDLCSSLIRARLAEEAIGDEDAAAQALAIQERVLTLRREVAEAEPTEKHQQQLADAEEVMERLRRTN